MRRLFNTIKQYPELHLTRNDPDDEFWAELATHLNQVHGGAKKNAKGWQTVNIYMKKYCFGEYFRKSKSGPH